jgi:CHAD domain-containing protein
MNWKPSGTAAESAQAALPKLAQKYFKAGRKAANGKRSAKELHRFRIATKEFRYSLELFRPVYGPSLERHIDALRGLQSTLGKLNDHYTLKPLFKGDKTLKAKLEQAMDKHLNQFHEQWKTFDADGEMQRWKVYFGRPRGSGSGKPA